VFAAGKRRSRCLPLRSAQSERVCLRFRKLPVARLRRRRQEGLRRKVHRSHYLPRRRRESLPSFVGPSAPRPGLSLHYRWRDYAALQSRPPCRESLPRGYPSVQLRVRSLSREKPLLEPFSAYSRTDRTCEEKASAPFPPLAVVGYHALSDGYSRSTVTRFRSASQAWGEARGRGSWIISSYCAISAS
jgi:hypothetical protein